MDSPQRVGSFRATGDDGGKHTVVIWQHYAAGGGPAWVPTATEFRTAAGQAVERLGKGWYRVAATGLMLTSDDPDAP